MYQRERLARDEQARTQSMAYDALILDNDGVIVTPTPAAVWQSVNWLAFWDNGAHPGTKHVIGLDRRDPHEIRAIAAEYGIDPETLWRDRERHAVREQREAIRAGHKQRYDDVEALPASLDIGIVSNNQHGTVEFIVDFFGLGDRVDSYYGRDPDLTGFSRRKPDPHYLERAIEDLDASNPLFVGDSNADLGAAAAAGIDAAFLRRPHREGYTLEYEPTYEVKNLREVTALCSPRRDRPVSDSPAGVL
ncbi:MAG: HAD family hydrolase [Halodesulfurarchaeum sp.]